MQDCVKSREVQNCAELSCRTVHHGTVQNLSNFICRCQKLKVLVHCTDEKENQIFLIYREIQSGAVAKSYIRKGFLIYEDMRKYFHILRRR
jgi:hypothetical protein